MDITVRRFEYGGNYTVGRLSVGCVYQCFTLEDKVRPSGVKVEHETAIPAGKYDVTITFSQHFQKELPSVNNVPLFKGIRIHSGNTDLDTSGCILVGEDWPGGDMIQQSRVAFDKLFPQMKEAIAKGEKITLEVIDTL
jgi:hypothetical protein